MNKYVLRKYRAGIAAGKTPLAFRKTVGELEADYKARMVALASMIQLYPDAGDRALAAQQLWNNQI